MRDISKRIFRHMPEARLQKLQGEPVRGRGTTVRLKAESGSHTVGADHGLGVLCRPLYVFMGDLKAEPGDVLAQNESCYTVLKAEPVELNGFRLGVRLTMERQVAADGGA